MYHILMVTLNAHIEVTIRLLADSTSNTGDHMLFTAHLLDYIESVERDLGPDVRILDSYTRLRTMYDARLESIAAAH